MAPPTSHAAMFNGSLTLVPHRPASVPRELPPCDDAGVPVIFPCHAASVEFHWLTRVMLSSCRVREYCFDELVRGHVEADNSESSGITHILCKQAVFVLQDQQLVP
mmetsp:Transcript_23967/g.47915  ORF Transcript_23967/g.47915 Transcript_23967/m.47915 type:complete len:106 (+) Transcript_23967:318-635(+)